MEKEMEKETEKEKELGRWREEERGAVLVLCMGT